MSRSNPVSQSDTGFEQAPLFVVAMGLFLVPLTLSLAFSALRFATRPKEPSPADARSTLKRRPPVLSVPPELDASLDDEQKCRDILRSAVELWRVAEAAIMKLEAEQPLRALMERELKLIGRSLCMHPELGGLDTGALTVVYPRHHWRMLHRELGRACRELTRICTVAKAA